MSDYLANLVSRALLPAANVRPQLSSIFEPPNAEGRPEASPAFETEKISEPPSIDSRSEKASKAGDAFPSQEPTSSKSRQATPPAALHKKTAPAEAQLEKDKFEPAQSDVALVGSSAFTRFDSHPVAEPSKAQGQTQPAELISRSPPSPPTEVVSQVAPPLRDRPPTAPSPQSSIAIETAVTEVNVERTPGGEGVRTEPPMPRPHVAHKPSVVLKPRQPQRAPAIRPAIPLDRLWQKESEPAREQPSPTIHVTIGRVEVRAVSPPVRETPRPKGPTVLSLEEYLRRRAGEGHR
jgi:hypothetical protein